MLKITDFTKRYGKKIAVDRLSLHIEPGEIYGFIGHNGAGKTTTLKACSGLLSFTEGEILINGKSIQKDPLSCKKEMAYIPDNPDIYEFLTGFDFLNFVADIYQIDKRTRKERIDRYGSLLGITEAYGLPISEYSHGMKQKVAIISALVHEPKLILMDEPFVGLDPLASHQLKQIMAEHCKEGGSIFFSTHVLEVAEKLCNKVAIIKEGNLIAAGTMEEVKGNSSLEAVFLDLEEKKG